MRSPSPRRVCLLALAVGLASSAACSRPNEEPRCRAVPATVLLAESVPSARLVPCIAGLPDGWVVDMFSADDDAGTFTLVHEDGAQLRVVLRPACVPADDPVVGDPPNDGVVQRTSTADGDVRRTSTFSGGCVVETLTLPHTLDTGGNAAIHEAIGFLSRDELAHELG
jgi:hypothetical protein